MVDHHPFARASCARCVDQGGKVVRLGYGGSRGQIDRIGSHEVGVGEIGGTRSVDQADCLDALQLRSYRGNGLEEAIVLGDNDFRARIVAVVLDLFWRGAVVNRHWGGATEKGSGVDDME